MSEQEKKTRKRYPKGEGPGRGNYPHKSRKGVEITPYKGGRTERFPTVWMTPEEKETFLAILERDGLTPTAWVMAHMEADANLTEGSKEA